MGKRWVALIAYVGYVVAIISYDHDVHLLAGVGAFVMSFAFTVVYVRADR